MEIGNNTLVINCRAKSPAGDGQLAMEVSAVLDRRGAHTHPPGSIAVSDSVALGIAALFTSPTQSGQVMRRARPPAGNAGPLALHLD